MKLTQEELDQRSRLKTVLKLKDIDRQTFANEIGRKIGYINQMLSGNRRVSESAVNRLSKRYKDINPDWIMNGEGEKFLDDKAPLSVQKVEEPITSYEPYHPDYQDLADEVWRLRRLVDVTALEREMGEMRDKMKGLEEVVAALLEEVRRLKDGK